MRSRYCRTEAINSASPGGKVDDRAPKNTDNSEFPAKKKRSLILLKGKFMRRGLISTSAGVWVVTEVFMSRSSLKCESVIVIITGSSGVFVTSCCHAKPSPGERTGD